MTKQLQLTRAQVDHFKRIENLTCSLAPLNIVVGGNNSGKSSLLQAIHFAVNVGVAHRKTTGQTFTQDALLYRPSDDFTDLRHGAAYQNQSNYGSVKFSARFAEQADDVDYTIEIYRGRNEGNVGCRRTGNVPLGQLITDEINPFSIYVPGLAGVPRREQFCSEGLVRRGVAGGDANLYLRNVLFLIKQKNKLIQLTERMRLVFPDFSVTVDFDSKRDVDIDVKVTLASSFWGARPLDLAGTGVLQALQIFSYITLFEPAIILLDEPDAHLHPNNQALLAKALRVAADESATQILCSTHSRHLVEALYDDAHFIWLRNGTLEQEGRHLDKIPLLMDLGAIDSLDRLRGGQIDWFVLTEDSDMQPLRTLLAHCGFNLARTELRSYASSSRLEAALDLAKYIHEVAPNTRVIIHRDRDFMTNEEVTQITQKISAVHADAFITAGSDIESYFIRPAHIAALYGSPENDVTTWLRGLAQGSHVTLQHSFTRKRDEIKNIIYRGRPNDAPDTLVLLGEAIPLSEDKWLGKDMLKMVRANAQERFGANPNPIQSTASLLCAELTAIRIPPN